MNGKKRHPNLWLYFAGLVFATIAAVFLLVTVLWVLLFQAGVVSIDPRDRHVPIVLFFFGSLLLGGVIALFVGKLFIRPIQNISNAFTALAGGDFSVRVSEQEKIEQIRDMAKKFNAMSHDLSHIETLRTDFVVNVSHEFKTPISSIEGYAMLLQNRGLSEEKREHYTGKILDNSRRLSELSSKILMLSKLENQQIVSGSTEFRLDEQLRRTVLMLENKWTEKAIEFDIELPKQMYYGSEALLECVWSNLIDNAIKASPRGGIIRISMETDADFLAVSIADSGCGMSEEVRKHIFEKFYQGDPSRKAEGNGLGLALVKRVVDLAQGQIRVESTEGRGSCFTVLLPFGA